jgi:DNA-binding transcriptional LysR family regulator
MVGNLARKVRERYRRIDLAFRPGRYGPAVVRELLEHTTDLAIARFEHASPRVESRAALVAAGVGMHFTTDSAVNQMTLDGVRIVSLTEEIPPIFGYLLWRTGDRDPALARVLAVSEQVLPTVA